KETARYLGLGLGTIVNVINPECIYLDGEVTSAWDLIEATVTAAQSERALTEKGGRTPLRVASMTEHSRLRGAAALIAAPTFAAPKSWHVVSILGFLVRPLPTKKVIIESSSCPSASTPSK